MSTNSLFVDLCKAFQLVSTGRWCRKAREEKTHWSELYPQFSTQDWALRWAFETHRFIAVSQFRGKFSPVTKLNLLIMLWFEPVNIWNKFKQGFSHEFNPTQPLIRRHLFPSIIQFFTSLLCSLQTCSVITRIYTVETFMVETLVELQEQQHKQQPPELCYQTVNTTAFQFPITPGKHSLICHYRLSNATFHRSSGGH